MTWRVTFLLPFGSWYFLYQRPHQIARRFVLNGHQVDVVGFEDIRDLWRRMRSFREFAEHRLCASRVYSFPLPPFRRRHVILDRAARTLADLWLRGYEMLASRGPITVVWVQGVGSFLPARRIARVKSDLMVWDICDDHRALSPALKQEVEEAERTLSVRTDIILTSSQRLYTYWHPRKNATYLVQNGVDIDAFGTHSQDASHSTSIDALNHELVAGYHGYIGRWFDFFLMQQVARALPKVKFVIVGPVDPEVRSEFSQLTALPNVDYLGPKPYPLVPGYVRAFHVGIIPFVLNDVTLATNPIKMYEYLAAGKPVVGSALPELEDVSRPGVVEVAHNADEFADRLTRALSISDNKSLTLARQDLARQNSWQRRYETIIRILAHHAQSRPTGV